MYGQPKGLTDNLYRLQHGCLWGNHLFFLSLHSGHMYLLSTGNRTTSQFMSNFISHSMHTLSHVSSGFKEIGGYDQLGSKFLNAISNDSLSSNNSCGIPPADSLHLYRGVHDDLPMLGLLTGSTFMGLYYWGSFQVSRVELCENKEVIHVKKS